MIMVEKLERSYVKHLNIDADENVVDDLMKVDIDKMTTEGWKVQSVAATHDVGETRAVIVTFERNVQKEQK